MQTISPQPFYGHRLNHVHAAFKKCGGVLNIPTTDGFGRLVVASNDLDSTFPTKFLQPDGTTEIEQIFAPLGAFGQVFDPNPYQPLAANVIKRVTNGSITLENPTNFEQGGSDIAETEVAVSHFSQPWEIPTRDLNSGLRVQDLFVSNAQALMKTLTSKITFWFSSVAFPSDPVKSAVAAFNLSNAASAYGRLNNRTKNLILKSAPFANLSHAAGGVGFQSGQAAHGWNSIHELAEDWPSGVYGFATTPTSLMIVSGVLIPFHKATLVRKLIGLKGMDIIIEFNSWFSTATRTYWCSLDIIFGVAAAQDDAAILIREP